MIKKGGDCLGNLSHFLSGLRWPTPGRKQGAASETNKAKPAASLGPMTLYPSVELQYRLDDNIFLQSSAKPAPMLRYCPRWTPPTRYAQLYQAEVGRYETARTITMIRNYWRKRTQAWARRAGSTCRPNTSTSMTPVARGVARPVRSPTPPPTVGIPRAWEPPSNTARPAPRGAPSLP